MKRNTLKEAILEAAEHYERHANFELNRAERLKDGSPLKAEIKEAYQFNRGRAKAMREALEFIEEYLG